MFQSASLRLFVSAFTAGRLPCPAAMWACGRRAIAAPWKRPGPKPCRCRPTPAANAWNEILERPVRRRFSRLRIQFVQARRRRIVVPLVSTASVSAPGHRSGVVDPERGFRRHQLRRSGAGNAGRLAASPSAGAGLAACHQCAAGTPAWPTCTAKGKSSSTVSTARRCSVAPWFHGQRHGSRRRCRVHRIDPARLVRHGRAMATGIGVRVGPGYPDLSRTGGSVANQADAPSAEARHRGMNNPIPI